MVSVRNLSCVYPALSLFITRATGTLVKYSHRPLTGDV